jgi:hypothetical protein
MVTVFRLLAYGGDSIGEARSIDEAIELARGATPGRYRVQEISIDFATGALRSFIWGTIIKRDDGGVELEPPPWID